ncbi:response regulator [Lysobacter sp. F6437]|uniref:response regulator n=1 Tax=Lysobacter sp. F6437 TaxID=3459296 RepID=UPI00403DB4D3
METGITNRTPPGKASRLAVVEDNDELRESVLLPELLDAGFEVTGMSTALELYRSMLDTQYDLVLLDIGLPDDNGLEITKRLRSLSPTLGIVILTGYNAPAARAVGLAVGADAYLTKPADMAEVVATLRNLARRVAGETAVSGHGSGHWRLDQSGWRLESPSGHKVTLNLAERQVIGLLAAADGMPVRREMLIAKLVDNIHDFDPHRLEVLVYRLRRKCANEGDQELPLTTVRGIGYALRW